MSRVEGPSPSGAGPLPSVVEPPPESPVLEHTDAAGDDRKPTRGKAGMGRLGVAFAIGAFAWIVPFTGGLAVLLPAKLAVIDPAQKVGDLAILSATASVVALVANLIMGAISDRTRSRWGGRNPWLVVGGIGAALSVAGASLAGNFIVLLLFWSLFSFFTNAYLAPLVAIIADRVPTRRQGTISGIYGTATLVGGATSTVIAAQFALHYNLGLLVLAPVPPIGALLIFFVAPDDSNVGEPRVPLTWQTFLTNFAFPRHAPDFYWALFGRAALVLGYYAVGAYALYIYTDYFHISTAKAASFIAISGVAGVVTGIIAGLSTGPISDWLNRRKPPVLFASLLIAAGAAVVLLWHNPIAYVVFGAIGGFGMGAYIAVDQALIIRLLPNQDTRGKDLGILNMANTAGQILAPLAGAPLIGLGGYGVLFILGIVCAVLSALLILPIRGTK